MSVLSRYLLILALLLPCTAAFAGTAITKIAQCKGLKVEAETDLKRTQAIEIYVNYGNPTQWFNYNDFGKVVRLNKDKNTIELHQSDMPIIQLNLTAKQVIVTAKESPRQTFSGCRFNSIGIKTLKSTTEKSK